MKQTQLWFYFLGFYLPEHAHCAAVRQGSTWDNEEEVTV